MFIVKPSFLSMSGLALILLLTGCQSVSKTTNKVGSWLGVKPPVPRVDANGIVDLSQTTLNQLEQFNANMPKNQWVYMKNKTQDIYILQNKSDDQSILSFRFNCQLSNQKPTFYLYNAKGEQILSAYDDKLGQIQFLLDNKNYLNPFNLYSTQKLETFKKELATAKTIKIYHAGHLYRFENQHAELLSKPVSCQE